jgi:uncharacterized delta-60 repeat protein
MAQPALSNQDRTGLPFGRVIKRSCLRSFVLALLHLFTLNVFSQDGGLDMSFDAGTGANDGVKAMGVQPDGKILIGGFFTGYNGTARNRIARLNANGSLDVTFNPGTGANLPVHSIALQPDGRILIGGDFTTYNGASRNRIIRLNADGSLDTTFNTGQGSMGTVNSIKVQSDGKILIGGSFINYDGTVRGGIARLNANGSLDSSFIPAIAVQTLLRCMAVQTDGRVLIGGHLANFYGTGREFIMRLKANGSLDSTFNPGTGANNNVTSVAIQPDGKSLIGGTFGSYNEIGRGRIARLNADGGLDATFNPGTGANSNVTSIAIQPDGKVLIGGTFTTFNGTGRNRIARLNADGSLDATFNTGTGANRDVYDVALQSDGRVLIGGWFTEYNGASRGYVARLQAMVTSVNDPQSRSDIRIHPNPASDDLHIQLPPQAPTRNWRYELVDGQGRRLRNGKFADTRESLSLNGIPTGTYVILIYQGGRLVRSERILHQ